jgi:hypothetical protein
VLFLRRRGVGDIGLDNYVGSVGLDDCLSCRWVGLDVKLLGQSTYLAQDD